MKTAPFSAIALLVLSVSTAAAYSPLIKATRSTLPDDPAISVAIKGEKDGQLDLLITVGRNEIEKAKPDTRTPPAQPVQDLLGDPKRRAEKDFRNLSVIVICVPDGEKARRSVTLWGLPSEIVDYDELLGKVPEQSLAQRPREAKLTISRDSLRKATILFECRVAGLGPSYQVHLAEYLDEAAQRQLKETKEREDKGNDEFRLLIERAAEEIRE